MLLTFQMLLSEAGINVRDVRLLRHAKGSGTAGMHPYVAWRDRRELFEEYQSTQAARHRRFFDVPYWAGFVATPSGDTVLAGVYSVSLATSDLPAFECPLSGYQNADGQADRYETASITEFAGYEGRLFVDWGSGRLAWRQFAKGNSKPIIELRRHDFEPPYPGHTVFVRQLSEIEALPVSWKAVLASARGVYLLTCPRTKEQYVGGAYSGGGFTTRWEQHARMQGDAIAFRSRDPADYRVSILEVAGSLTTDDDIHAMEQRWKEKLQSREMGLNRN
jgi:hypothetical protein